MKDAQVRRPRPYKTTYRIKKTEWYGHACTLRGAARAAFPKILAEKGLVVEIRDINGVLLVAMMWQRRKGIWCAAHDSVPKHFEEPRT